MKLFNLLSQVDRQLGRLDMHSEYVPNIDLFMHVLKEATQSNKIEGQILKQPILYLPDFFERNRTLYYDNLMRVREKMT